MIRKFLTVSRTFAAYDRLRATWDSRIPATVGS